MSEGMPSRDGSSECPFISSLAIQGAPSADGVLNVCERFELFVSLIAQINRSIRRIKGFEMRGLGLRGIHVMILYHLSKAGGGLTQAELVELCAEDKATISRATADLIDKHIVETVPPPIHSHRNIPLRLTEQGKGLITHLVSHISRAVYAGSSGLKETERMSLYRLLGLVNENLLRYVRALCG